MGELEFPLDILDDISSEGQEIAAENGNGWFAYTPLLHRIREAGTLCKLFDSIDERALTPVEVKYFAELLSGSNRSLKDLSDKEFVKEMGRLSASSPLVYDAVSGDMRPFINIRKLRVALGAGFRGKVLYKWCPCLV